MNLVGQLARRDEERVMQGEELERLKAIVARLAERQSVDQQHIDSLKTEHNAEIQSLQEQLRQAYGAKCSKEVIFVMDALLLYTLAFDIFYSTTARVAP